jgi:hypothetical protein
VTHFPIVEINGLPTAVPPRSERPELPDVDEPELFLAFSAVFERARRSGRIVFEAAVTARAAIQLLVEKGIITEEEVNERFASIGDTIGDQFEDAGLGVLLAPNRDKYDLADDELPDIDCEARIPMCKAACCSMRFPLSEQDVLEGLVQWDLVHPYANRQGEDGWCIHCEPESKRCGVYANRPTICRTYDCRNDARIWADFDAYEINPDLFDDQGRVRHPDNERMDREAEATS